jgi:hypothetical protein
MINYYYSGSIWYCWDMLADGQGMLARCSGRCQSATHTSSAITPLRPRRLLLQMLTGFTLQDNLGRKDGKSVSQLVPIDVSAPLNVESVRWFRSVIVSGGVSRN